jgi:hypothetical protein
MMAGAALSQGGRPRYSAGTHRSNEHLTCAACFSCRHIAAAFISSPILLAAAAGQAKSLKEAEQE